VEGEGRYQDWTRDKYTDVVRLLSDYGARLVGFDVFFIEPSTNLVSESQLRALGKLGSASVEALLQRSAFDEMFRQALTAAGHVSLAQPVVVPAQCAEPANHAHKTKILPCSRSVSDRPNFRVPMRRAPWQEASTSILPFALFVRAPGTAPTRRR